MHDTRRYKRFKLNDCGINAKMTLFNEVKVIDISISGISLEANSRLNIGSDYKLKLEGRNTISMRCTVVWCTLGDTRKASRGEVVPIYSAGMQFKDMSIETVTDLQYLIESHKIEEVHSATTNTETENESKKTVGESDNKDVPVIPQEFVDKVEYLYKWHATMGYYKMLDIKEYAANEQIRYAYLRKVNELHPDKFPSASDDLKQKLNAILAYLNAAYSTLGDLQEREKYDRMHIRRTKL